MRCTDCGRNVKIVEMADHMYVCNSLEDREDEDLRFDAETSDSGPGTSCTVSLMLKGSLSIV